MRTIFPIIGVFTLAGLLYVERQDDTRLKWIFKPLTSLLFILTAVAGSIEGTYATLVLIGLALGFTGDVLLISKSKQWFMAGLVVFLLGHVAYVAAFNDIMTFTSLSIVWFAVIGGLGGVIFLYLRPHLGDMQIPVILYIGVITVMVWSALAVYFETDEAQGFRQLVALGAVCFYLSDLGVALDRFTTPPFKQAFWSLPLYYVGQFMLALSIGV